MNLDPTSLIDDDIGQSWLRCLPHWIAAGRVEDKPHGVHKGSYSVSAGKRLGMKFANTFYQHVPFFIARLRDPDSTIRLIAYDLIELVAWEFHTRERALPNALLQLDDPIPETALKNIQGCHLFFEYEGTTVGTFLPFMLKNG